MDKLNFFYIRGQIISTKNKYRRSKRGYDNRIPFFLKKFNLFWYFKNEWYINGSSKYIEITFGNSSRLNFRSYFNRFGL